MQKRGKKNRKHGRNKAKCERYRSENRREENKKRKAKKCSLTTTNRKH